MRTKREEKRLVVFWFPLEDGGSAFLGEAVKATGGWALYCGRGRRLIDNSYSEHGCFQTLNLCERELLEIYEARDGELRGVA